MTFSRRWQATTAAAVAALAFGAYAAGSASASPAQRPLVVQSADSSSGTPTNAVTVTGSGTAAGTPDTMRLDLDVQGTASDAASALSRANAATTKVQSTLKAHGVKAADLKTSSVSLQPQYSGDGNPPRITGFMADESLTATLRDLGKAGAAINAAVQAGGNAVRVNGASLDLASDSTLVTQARAAAFKAAKDKAQQYADLAGRSLGAVVSITENVQGGQPVPYDKFAAEASAQSMAPVPVQAGSQQVEVDVQVVWALG